ncbi:MAG: polyribonucleotide nucleotidyltransferase [Flammeovirgaceae bacterium]|nr:polyribonucleotide nucleotidyltransferase [Flammeovirgaceae bacterium]|tara:strand:+ start:263 stop:2386 length:2124 start_codon:yes stop_codon:yes gene_type:complete
MIKPINVSTKLPDGREVSIETGKLAKQADGSVVLTMGKTMILASAVSKKDAMDNVDFLPLSVDYQEKFASAGKIPGGFLKREGRLSDHEVLICRLVDRVLRPLFPSDYHADTQILLYLISADKDVLPDALAALAASAALSVSDIPFNGPIAEVRVVKCGKDFIVNPTPEQIEKSSLNLMVGASYENICMVEGESKEVSEEDIIEALKVAHDAIKGLCELQNELAKKVGNIEKREYSHENSDEDLLKDIKEKTYDKLYKVAEEGISNKKKRGEKFKEVREEYLSDIKEDEEFDEFLFGKYFHDIEKEAIRNSVLDKKIRLDGRKLNEIRPIWSEIDYLPNAHGSSVFTRGETQSLTTVTLGTKLDEQMIDGAMHNGYNKFILHYNFPGFSTGEVRPNRGAGRREIGHGNLALRALKNMIPSDEDNPYTIRIVSDILESNGSSSMATVCAGSLALMDAGVEIKKPVSGIAMGMISDSKSGKYAILSDILGDEDHLGDMDFKVTGTADGITACQMDIKIDGLSFDVLKEALNQAKEGRLHILSEMNKTIDKPNKDLKSHAPRSYQMSIAKDMIGAVIGPGGKIIQEIQKESGATVLVEEVEENGIVSVFASNQDEMDNAVERVKAIVAVPEVGETYVGKVKSIKDFGAFIEFMPGKDGLLHISEIKWERVESMDGVLEEGEEIKVKLIEVDRRTGKFRLSRKALIPKPEK